MNSDKEKKTRPQDKVNEKTAAEFKEACAKAGVSMGTQLTKMMDDFIMEVNEE